jgi:hypothetical protein
VSCEILGSEQSCCIVRCRTRWLDGTGIAVQVCVISVGVGGGNA